MAKDMLSTTPAEAALGSVTVILTMIRVGFLLVHVGRLLANVYAVTGFHGQQRRLCQPWTSLRRCL